MRHVQIDHASDSRVRFVFSGVVVSVDLAADATFEDIAKALGALPERYRKPIAIAVTLAIPAE
jgi:hypothetical protein